MKRAVLILSALAIGFSAPAAAWAQRDRDSDRPGAEQNEAREGVRSGRIAPLSQVIAEIARRTPGRQLDARLEQMGGMQVYRIMWSTNDGRRIDFIVDAQTGRIISQQGG